MDTPRSNSTYMCPVDRRVMKGTAYCSDCKQMGINMGKRWRAPRRNDHSAWKQIQSGDYLWEHPKAYFPEPSWKLGFHPTRRVKRDKWPIIPIKMFEFRESRLNNVIREDILRRMNDLSEAP